MSRFACPACGKTAMFMASLDRYVHVDGSENLPCWLRIARGETTVPTGIPAATRMPVKTVAELRTHYDTHSLVEEIPDGTWEDPTTEPPRARRG